ncbi:SGNH/GDSL hydrolase family protein [Noviherbaspirillum massiliense]|uniref:SGNH/GDSL hydrolase family protein n=1 Tax=Noviherbaspirillum massiliense TaxID=1465823 RepID=UPI00068BCA40|nr:GDSL-type esterase/lipase family protein [Noviherbaspirillum massiliense]
MRHWWPEMLAVPLLPLLLLQGRRTRRVTPRLPEAGGPHSGIMLPAAGAPAATPLRLLAIGESPVAGVGVSSYEEAITAQFARVLAACMARPVHWQAYGANGATVTSALKTLLPSVPRHPVDILLVAFGVNDSTEFRSVARYRAALQELINDLDASASPKLVIISGVPPLHIFPALPQPLRHVLGLKAQALDRSARQLTSGSVNMLHVPMPTRLTNRGLMATDGYHPSALGAALWANCLLDAVLAHPASGKTFGAGP